MTSSAPQGLRFRDDIQGLRALSVLLILLFHLDFAWAAGGFIGVDVFMVISGYLITGVLLKTASEGLFLSFWDRRLRRLLPALLAMLAFSFGLATLSLLPDAFEQFATTSAYVLGYVANFKFAQNIDYFSPSSAYNYLLHTWSLAVEEQFYFLMPFFVFALRRTRRWPVWIAAALAASFALNVAVFAASIGENYAFYMLPTRAWEFLMGGLAHVLAGRASSRGPVVEGAGLLGLAMILAAFVAFDGATPFPDVAALLPTVGCVLVLYSGISAKGAVHRMLGVAPMRVLGDISYSFYLFHWPVIVFARHFYGEQHLPARAAPIVVLAILALSWLSYRFIETPFRNKRIPAGRFYAGVVAASLALIGGWTWAFVQNGAPQRVPVAYQSERTDEMRSFGRSFLPCIRALPQARSIDDLCPWGEPDRPASVLIWGDSHAGKMTHGFQAIRADLPYGGVAAVNGACAPVPGYRPVANPRCADLTQKVRSIVEANPQLETVILAARWTNVFHEPAPTRQPGAAPETLDERREALRGLLEFLRDQGRRVVLVGPVPEAGVNALNAAWVQSHFGADLVLDHPREAEEARVAVARAALQSYADDGLAVLIDPMEVLCDAAVCPSRRDGRQQFSDDDHLSVDAAAQVARRVADVIPRH
ncbi:acyltransferase family protein [Albimonas sp. CAU 1670]|uniref:acyltransferase family protein n=1 Tax=Albimonas sp. CAU 1670 TaxID=3032599 RepID=UPI0023DC448D|nr:acyltransferase family protein [Albimonas sp. CAU 1670]MDF2232010.1 acyltransferase family protein [Albimonas sp. CAU 1670]